MDRWGLKVLAGAARLVCNEVVLDRKVVRTLNVKITCGNGMKFGQCVPMKWVRVDRKVVLDGAILGLSSAVPAVLIGRRFTAINARPGSTESKSSIGNSHQPPSERRYCF